MESPSETSTKGQSLSGLEGLLELVGLLKAVFGVRGTIFGGGDALGEGQVTLNTAGSSGSGDQQLSDNQQPITTVTSPINKANMI